jgi:hypothetical protein
MSKYNKIPNQPKTHRVVIRVTESEKNQLHRMAFNQNKTLTKYIWEKLFLKYVGNDIK